MNQDHAVHDNPIVAAGFQVVLGHHGLKRALELVDIDPAVTSATDEQLVEMLEEATAFRRANTHDNEQAVVYAALVFQCAHTRCRAVGVFRANAQVTDHPALDARLSGWLRRAARAALELGMTQVVLGDLQIAFRTFAEADLLARTLPDLDEPRVDEIVWATFGMMQVASRAGQREAVHRLDQTLGAMVPGWNVPLTYLVELDTEFRRLFLARDALAARVPPNEDADDSASTVAMNYASALGRCAADVDRGAFTLEQGVERLLATTGVASVPHSLLATVGGFLLGTARTDPVSASTKARLHLAVVRSPVLPFDRRAIASAERGLGVLLSTVAYRVAHGMAEMPADELRATWAEAAVHLQSAHSFYAGEGDDELAARCEQQLATCYRGTGDIEEAIAWSNRAIARYERMPDRLDDLAVSIGNLADIQEQTGNLLVAMDNHRRAYHLFIEANDRMNAIRALTYLVELSERIGLSDEALRIAAAAEPLIDDAADISTMVAVYLRLARSCFRTQRLRDAIHAIERAESLLRPALKADEPDRGALRQFHEIRVWEGTLLGMVGGGRKELFDAAIRSLDVAAQVAHRLGDDNRLAQVVLAKSKVYAEAGDHQAALGLCRSLQESGSRPRYLTEAALVEGRVLLSLDEHAQAVPRLEAAIGGYRDLGDRDKQWMATGELAKAREGLGDLEAARNGYEQCLDETEQLGAMLGEEGRVGFRGSMEEYYDRLIWLYAAPDALDDPASALHWVERSKARAFLATMGLSSIPLDGAPEEAKALLLREHALIDSLRRAQAEADPVLMAPTEASGTPQLEYQILRDLRTVWDQLAPTLPEYVDLRTAKVTEWQVLQRLLES